MGYLCGIDNVFTSINLWGIERSKCRERKYFLSNSMANIPNTSLELLEKTAARVSDRLKTIAHDTDIAWNAELDAQMHLLLNRAEEVHSKAFVVIVVGPVKSGKSTFVNALAHAHVSPTHFLECTVRPSVISQCKAGEECSITTFRQTELDPEASKADHVEAIIDYIKGLSYADLSGLEVRHYPLNEENLTEHVEQPIDNKVVRVTTDNVLTSITAPGGDFLGQDIFLVDMPGFDGLNANLEDKAYPIITHRADLVIFIQSSNSAISKISSDFFDILREGNGSAPVCLIHNYFESAYWRTQEEQQRAIRGQMEKAKEIIRQRGFNLPDANCFSINLGKVADNREEAYGKEVLPEYRSELEAATASFGEIEKELYQHVISSQHTTRLNNCLGRIRYEKELLCKMIDEQLTKFETDRGRYHSAEQELDAIREDHQLVYSRAAFPLHFTADDLSSSLDGIANVTMSQQLTMGTKYNGATARGIVTSMLGMFAQTVKTYVDNHVSMSDYLAKINAMTESRYLEIRNALDRVGGIQIKPLSGFKDEELKPVDMSVVSKAYDVEQKIGDTYLIDRYNYERMRSMMNDAKMTVIGVTQPSEPGVYRGGCLQTTILPRVQEEVEQCLQDIIRKRSEAYSKLLEEKRSEVLASIIPDFDQVDARITALKALKTKLEGIQFT